jgi:hypothetical protein
MTTHADRPDEPATRSPRLPWLALAMAMLWVAVARVPLVVNAETHLDSDLAVDGLTLLDSLAGRWRLHYPGTPHIGTPAVLLSLPQAAIWGSNPWTLVSGGVVAYELVVVATFLLAWRLFGAAAAAWSLVPLAFASIGTVWLSGRITGGHLLATAWHAAAFALLVGQLRRGGALHSLGLGLWCGFGLYVDGTFLYSFLGIAPAMLLGGFGARTFPRGLAALASFTLGLLIGYAPRHLALAADGYDAYHDSFATIFGDEGAGIDWSRGEALARQHALILARDCWPRLFGGHRLPGFQSDPRPETLAGRSPWRDPPDYSAIPILASLLGLTLSAASFVALAVLPGGRGDPATWVARAGLVASSAAILGGFIIHRNIFNSDNYRYLVLLEIPFAVGFGLLAHRVSRRGSGGVVLAAGAALALGLVMTLDSLRWYRGFGWIDAGGVVRRPLADPFLDWLDDHPDRTPIYGDYWDVYRLAFLTGGRVRGTPYPEYPDRYPEISDRLPGHRPRVLLARTVPAGPGQISAGQFNRRKALEEGGSILAEGPGYAIIDWPRGEE